jgi:hypothetical protein
MPGFFDRAPNELAKMHSRDLIFDCPRHVRKYLLEMSTYIGLQKISKRLEKLSEGDRNDDMAEAIDRDITRAMLAAERSCKSTAWDPWSKAIHEVMNRLFILKRALSQSLTGIDMSISIKIMQSKMSNPVKIPTERSELLALLRQARRDRRDVIKQGLRFRKSYQHEKLKALQMASPEKLPEKVEKMFLATLASKEMFRRVPSARASMSGGISMIKVPVDPKADPKAPTTVFKSIVKPSEVEQHILDRNQSHFAQAHPTPLAHPTITDLL